MLVAAVALIALGGLVWGLLSPVRPEPVYQGKRLGQWLETYSAPYTTTYDQQIRDANEAVRHIGTNGIPTLLWLLQARDSALKLKLVALARKQHWVKLNFTPAQVRRDQAVTGFAVLGSEARPAVPGLVRLCERNISPEARLAAVRALGFIGPGATGAVSLLVKVVTATNAASGYGSEVRASAVTALGQIHAEPNLYVDALTNALNDADAVIRARAIWALGSLGEDARTAVPALFRLLEDQSPYVRRYAAGAIRGIDPETAERRKAELDAALAPQKQ